MSNHSDYEATSSVVYGQDEHVPKDDPMSIWLKATDFQEQASHIVFAYDLPCSTLAFGKFGPKYVFQVGVNHELLDDQISRWARMEHDIQQASRLTKPMAAPEEITLIAAVGIPVLY